MGGSLGLPMMPQCTKCLDLMNRVVCEYSAAGESRMEHSKWRAMCKHDVGELHLGSLKVTQLGSGGIIKWSEMYQGQNCK